MAWTNDTIVIIKINLDNYESFEKVRENIIDFIKCKKDYMNCFMSQVPMTKEEKEMKNYITNNWLKRLEGADDIVIVIRSKIKESKAILEELNEK